MEQMSLNVHNSYTTLFYRWGLNPDLRVKPLPGRSTLHFQTAFLSWSWTIKVTFSGIEVRIISNVGWKFGPYFGRNGAS